MKKFFDEFKEFISRGNVMDMAVGVIMGTAFTAIVNALVKNILTPLLGIVLNGVDFSDLIIKVGNAKVEYGLFIQAIINFLLISLVIFCMVKALNGARNKVIKKKEEEGAQEEEELEASVVLLQEIRDLLAKQNAETAAASEQDLLKK
ncbi:large-conductance mechanosensitive channel protein MscL [Ileibacterium valens]|uniref:Large-conductance mechanosensitive channel n=1 Tax=Ileibacterium valens TaxID=1862668 RepID=A0A1U7NJE3_9FIRM|nr:large-conductance mechanosensitive channel protein MscL [Ileibacterium valens]OLU36524.1 mechanosensitive ion channel protein MscL [Erysipelotrichaceae bacterium NYU-BL-F16]OLU39920.1 mechanosensitive ion channel protein MscL [Erysipelotrichaceae bacterium NYU-BL-E8]OLU43381.1 mechanosensitive ion channel protein MscL [Ileibacterium valens]